MSGKNDCIIYCVGGCMVLVGLAVGISWPFLFHAIYKESLELKNASETYKLWVETPMPLYLEIYLFNWTNAVEFLKNKRLKPEFEEVGPFWFREVHEKVNIKWLDNDTVTYNQIRRWNFVANESVSLDLPITNLNVVLVTVTKMASNRELIIKAILEFITNFYKEKLLVTRPARQWLFEGMNDGLLTFIKNFMKVPYDKFGWFYNRNLSSTFDGTFNVRNGERSIYDLGMLELWNGVKQTRYFPGRCGKVEGSTGELFAPLKDTPKNLTIFSTDFCSAIPLTYNGTVSKDKVNGYHYVGGEDVFDNGTKYPENKCYCSGNCPPSGIRDLTLCRQSPLFVSYPHFYLADPVYRTAVGGMKPNKSEHEFFIEIEPLTGLPLEVRAALQLNVHIEALKVFEMFANLPSLYIPTIWFRQRASITPELLLKPKLLETVAKTGFIVFFVFAMFGLLIIIIRAFQNLRRRKELILVNGDDNNDDDDDDKNDDDDDKGK